MKKILDPQDYKKLGDLLKQKRKQANLRQEDLADSEISVSTISNIERGLSNVKLDKIEYLCEKLSVSVEDHLNIFIQDEKAKLEDLERKLFFIETRIDTKKFEFALSDLKSLGVESNHLPKIQAKIHY
ncbi:helix-turn-helix domain-containing protein [Risungbinella massiliensis]|uniref:helix-turn-helix domain-containing protein n=1 Tax=Risungbinella massiliensis TaxID=1329796 RepID=UPI00164CE99B|nr:helix-turn-helix transcriptional regulator [Risungbinella massiliensis]